MEDLKKDEAQLPATSKPVQSIRRRRGHAVAQTPFAGRLGGNQEFIADDDDESILEKQPDAAPLPSVRAAISLQGILQSDLWRMAFLEGWGTFLLVFVLGAVASGLTTLDTSPFANSLYAALVSWLGLSLFTYSLGPVSGAHLNPAISMSTFFAGLSTLPRTVVYIVAQSIGAIVAGWWLRLGLGDAYFPKDVIPGCTVDPQMVSRGQLFVLEYTFSQALIFLAFGVGLDPRVGKTLGPAYAPALVGVVLALGNLTSSFARPGYTGMSFNPARCLGLMTAKVEMQYHYIHWLGPLSAAMVNGVFYHLVPPWTRDQSLFDEVFHPSRRLKKEHV